MCAIIMQDISGCTTLRSALIAHRRFPRFADQISTHLAASLLCTSDVVMNHKEKKLLAKSFVNPEMSDVYEMILYNEPYNDEKKRNIVTPQNADFVRKTLYENKALHLAVAKHKFDFLTMTQSLIHGDLRTAAILINDTETYVFDAEFACYGPAGYDIGFLIANLFIGWCNADAVMEEGPEKTAQKSWLESTIAAVIDLFAEKYHRLFKERVSDTMAKTEGFEDWYLGTILQSATAVTGLEMIRTVVGQSRAPDITSIPDINKRVRAEQTLINAAIPFILNPCRFRTGAAFVEHFLTEQKEYKSRT
jgi:5-methylthioribose kinase